MDTRNEQARRLERLAADETSLARSQALDAEASRLRSEATARRPIPAMPFFRN